MKQTWKQLTIATLVCALVVTPVAVFAHEGDESGDEVEYTTLETTSREDKGGYAERLRERLEAKKAERMAKLEDKKANLRERLDNKKKQICERHQQRINRIMGNMGDRRERAFDRITQIYEAIKGFYVEKSLSAEGYDNLVSAVDAAKEAAESAKNTQQQAPEINCDSEQPRADVADFREKRSASIDAMREYRDAVKLLAKAVREAAVATKNAEEN